MSAVIRWAKIKLRGVYTCRRCGTQALGDVFDVELSHCEPSDIERVTRQRPPSHAMPVSWASFTDGFQCPKCTIQGKS